MDGECRFCCIKAWNLNLLVYKGDALTRSYVLPALPGPVIPRFVSIQTAAVAAVAVDAGSDAGGELWLVAPPHLRAEVVRAAVAATAAAAAAAADPTEQEQGGAPDGDGGLQREAGRRRHQVQVQLGLQLQVGRLLAEQVGACNAVYEQVRRERAAGGREGVRSSMRAH